MTMHGGVCLVVDANPAIIQRAIERGFLDVQAALLEEAIQMAEKAKADKRPWASACTATQPSCSRRPWRWAGCPDIMSEMCPCHDPLSYIPAGYTPEEAAELRAADRSRVLERRRANR